MALLPQFGGSMFNDAKTKSLFDSEASISALQTMQDWKVKHKIADIGGTDGLVRGKGGMVFAGTWDLSYLLKAKTFKWAAPPMPTFGTQKGTWASAHIMCIPLGIKGKQLKAAWDFIKWMSDHSNLPVRKSYLESAEFKALPLQSAYAKLLSVSVYETSVRRQMEVRAAYDTMIANAYEGKGDPRQLAAKASAIVNQILLKGK